MGVLFCINPLPGSYTNIPTVVTKSGKPTVNHVLESMMIGNQSTIADVISKEVQWSEKVETLYSAGKTRLESKSTSASRIEENTIE